MLENHNVFSVFEQRFPADRSRAFIMEPAAVTISYAAMEARSSQIANVLVGLGLAAGQRVAVQVGKSAEALMLYLACVRAGLVYLPLNTGYTEAELAYFFQDASPSLIVGVEAPVNNTNKNSASLLESLALDHSAKYESLVADGCGSLQQAADKCLSSFTTIHSNPDDLAAILYTSGTTGRPKGAMLSHRNLSSNALTLKDYWGWSGEDVLLHALPLFHVHGLFVACHCVMAAGATMILLPKFDPAAVVEQLPKATVMMGVPTFYTRLLDTPAFTAELCAGMRLFISGSAPLLAQTHQQFEQRSGHRILERYGMSETGMLVSNPLKGERRAGTVGLPLPGVEVRVVDERNLPIAEGEVGSIQVKGPNIFQGYWQMPEKTAQEFSDDGFFITGDQGTVSDDGYISIVGREKDMVITGGYNVYPKEVEIVLDSLAGVVESAVIGLADKDFGEKVVAVVVAETTVDEDQLIEQLKIKLAAYKVPKKIYQVEALPRNTMGKVQKNQLRKVYS